MDRSNVFKDFVDVKCSVCGKALMDDPEMSMVNIIQNVETRKIVHIKPCCKGNCDKIISKVAKKGEISGWKDLTDFLNPYLYMRHVMAVLNSMHEGCGFDNSEAFEDYKNLVLNVYPYITRNMTDDEKEAAISEVQMPF